MADSAASQLERDNRYCTFLAIQRPIYRIVRDAQSLHQVLQCASSCLVRLCSAGVLRHAIIEQLRQSLDDMASKPWNGDGIVKAICTTPHGRAITINVPRSIWSTAFLPTPFLRTEN